MQVEIAFFVNSNYWMTPILSFNEKNITQLGVILYFPNHIYQIKTKV